MANHVYIGGAILHREEATRSDQLKTYVDALGYRRHLFQIDSQASSIYDEIG